MAGNEEDGADGEGAGRGMRVAGLLSALAGALWVSAFALAGTGTHERRALTAADERVARLSVLSRSELPQTNAWKEQPSSPSSMPATLKECAPQRDLSRYTISGQTERSFVFGVSPQTRDGESMFGNATVFQTAAMAEGDWKASSVSYKTLGCFLSKFAHAPGSRISLAGVERLTLHAGIRSVAMRAHLRISAPNGLQVPAAFDLAVFLLGRCQEMFVYGYIDGHGTAFKHFVSDEPLLLRELAYEGKAAGC